MFNKLQVKKIGVALAGLGFVMSSQVFAHDYGVKLSGRLQIDGAHFWEDNERQLANPAGGTEVARPGFDRSMVVRRADLFVKGHLPAHWLYRVGFNVANIAKLHEDNEFSMSCDNENGSTDQCLSDRAHMADRERMLNAWVGYGGFEDVFVAFGRLHLPQGLDHWMDDSYTTFMERASVAEAFAPRPGIGVYLEGMLMGGDLGYAVGALTPDQGDRYPNHRHDNLVFGGRIHYTPFNDHGNVFHVGASAYRYNIMKNTEMFGRVVGFGGARVRETPPIIGSVFRGNGTDGTSTVDYTTTWGLELGGVMGPFFGKAEYMRQRIDSRNGAEDFQLYGYTAEVSYMITGESRRYDRANGVFGGVKPDGSHGAWEAAVRFTRLDLSDRGNKEALENKSTFPAQPGSLKNWTLGVNWYATKNVKFQVNYIHSRANYVRTLANNAAAPNWLQKGHRRLNTLAARGQVMFG